MPTNPVISNADRILDATAVAAQTEFVVPWVVIGDSEGAAVNDLVVLIDGEFVDPADFDFAGVAVAGLSGVWNGGTVVLDDACAGGERVIIYSDRAPRRTGSYLEGKSLPFTELDKLMNDFAVQMRDMQLRLKRSVTITAEDYLDGEDADGKATDLIDGAAAAVAAAEAAQLAASQAGADRWTRPVQSILANPPGGPAVGARYLVASAGTTGAFVGFENQVAEWSASGWIFTGAPTDGQQLYLQSTQRRYRWNTTNSTWKKVNSKYVFHSDFVSYATALAFAVTASAALVIDEDGTVAANAAPTVAHRFSGGILTINNGVTLDLSKTMVSAGPEKIFDTSPGGVVKMCTLDGGSSLAAYGAKAAQVWIEWWGAVPYDQTAGQMTANVNAFKAALNATPSGTIAISHGSYWFNDVIAVTTFSNGVIEGRGRYATNLRHSDNTKNLLSLTNAYNITIRGLAFWDGYSQVYFDTNNSDVAQLNIMDCVFRAPRRAGVESSQDSNSTLLNIWGCDWVGHTAGNSYYVISYTDYTFVRDGWAECWSTNCFYNGAGTMRVTGLVGVGANQPANSEWFNSFGHLWVEDCRLNNDGGGYRTIVNYRAAAGQHMTLKLVNNSFGQGTLPYPPDVILYSLPQHFIYRNNQPFADHGGILVKNITNGTDAYFAYGLCEIEGPRFFTAAGSSAAFTGMVAHANALSLEPWALPRLADVKWAWPSGALLVATSSNITTGTAAAPYFNGETMNTYTATADDAMVALYRSDVLTTGGITTNGLYTYEQDFYYTGSAPITIEVIAWNAVRRIELEPGYRKVRVPFCAVASATVGIQITALNLPNGAVLMPLRGSCFAGRKSCPGPNLHFLDDSGNAITDNTITKYSIGDRFEYCDPASGGYEGKVVKTAGYNGAEVWTTYGTVT